ncbi:MAG TPA: succinate dehydrogenase, cytochrome b556 subunit [Planctomycetota bacterium]|nr:succinate dehydrogenase, cytochrome b556 subunit [Planctomycetota bacterium]
MIKKIFSVFGELMLNRNEGTVAFILHRLSGLCLVGYIFLHLVVVGSEFIFGKGSFNWLMGTFENPLIKALEICLISVIAFHLINGLRIIVVDFLNITRTQRAMFWLVMLLCVAAVITATVIFLPKII